MKPSIDTIEASKMQAAINLGKYQEETRRWKNKKVKQRYMKEGDLVLRRISKTKQKGNMYNKWEAHLSSPPWQDQRLAGFARWKATKTHIHGTSTCYRSIMCKSCVRATGGK